ncbi:outer membrane beta-barrel protein [Gelidibacter sp.]|uniref:outer membrane beta-barrel protein n=1 Tax=Gelidibacter sp. TaxID=2018083 RepID=UPI0032661499
MKRFVFITIFLFSAFLASAQKTYTIDGQSVQLKSAIEGPLDLLWNSFDNQYRYFIRTEDHQLLELLNTKNANNTFQEEYKSTLTQLTNNTLNASKTNFNLRDLAHFVDQYNASVSPEYASERSKFKAELRLGVFGGITNSPFVGNPENIISSVFGGELEMLTGKNKKHSGYLQLRHVAEKDAFKYETTELSLGYRYRFINTSAISFYGDVKFATLNFTRATVTFEDSANNTITQYIDDTAFDVPLIIGVGADIRLSPVIYANVSYNQIFAIFFKNQGNFSSDITLGLKFKIN